jgi:SpoVK/Ycf46/Vps4 family AAA+-type ATPase
LAIEEIEGLVEETFEHLEQGRYRMALTSAKRVYEESPEDYQAVICFAWASLENGNSREALELANHAVKISPENLVARTYRGFLLSRMSIYDGALADLDFVIKNKTPLSELAVKSKIHTLAGLENYTEAIKILKAFQADNPPLSGNYKYLESLLNLANGNEKAEDEKSSLPGLAEEAFKNKEYWFSFWAAKKISNSPSLKKIHRQAHLMELDSLIYLFRIKDALARAENLKNLYKGENDFDNLYQKILNISSEGNVFTTFEKKEMTGRTDLELHYDQIYKVLSTKTYNFIDSLNTEKRIYLLQFSEENIKYIGAEIVIDNPFYKKRSVDIDGMAIWYLNNIEVGRNRFILSLEKDWKAVEFVQNWGTNSIGFWTRGQGYVEIYIEEKKICTRYFLVGKNQLINFEKKINLHPAENSPEMKSTVQPEDVNKYISSKTKAETLENLIREVNSLTGIKEVKTSVQDFVDYLGFMNERKKSGLKIEEKVSINCVFFGNPGTGKTTVARKLGKIFKAMGILSNGHVIEVDRAELVGQYVGETAQKALKVIEAAKGGILFIDEAYSLVREEKEDFGKEALEVLLKRMDEYPAEFSVIAAGYPNEMNTFINSNPGIKSRFTHFFNFEDLNPDELMEVFKKIAVGEEYILTGESEEIIKKEFIDQYRNRDESFGNARMVKNYFNEIKVQLGKRYLKIPQQKRTREAMCTIFPDDISAAMRNVAAVSYHPGIDEELLNKSLGELNKLTGLESVKKEINEIVKLARFFAEQGDHPEDKFTSHFAFLGNPGTGKTTVARLFSEIYCALGILPKGHLIETDRQGLVGVYVGQTAQKTKDVIDKSLGGTLFIDEAYTLNRKSTMASNDFGNESIETLLKRMEDDRGKFIVIAAGYTDEMNSFLESNPGLQSRFTRKIIFEDFSPDELLGITEKTLQGKGHTISEDAKQQLKKYYTKVFRDRDKTFGNARLVRDLVERVLKNHLLSIADIPSQERKEINIKEITKQDILEVTSQVKVKSSPKIQGDSDLLNGYLLELSELAGLDSVKNSVKKLVSSLKVAKLREEKGLGVIPKNLHSVFMGNPGTGKTTIARLLSKIYKETGVLERGHLVEVDRSGLVAGYQGQTAIKTDTVIQHALGGTLFIDEAYSLTRNAQDFGQEAIDTLIKRMEDYQGKFVVIVAGYTNEMKDFIESNPGLKSRFTNYYTFDDYTPRQLLEIALVITAKNSYKLDEGAWQLLLDICTELYGKRDKNFGNARMVRNILYKAISNQEERILTLYNPDTEDLSTIIYDDVARIDLGEL